MIGGLIYIAIWFKLYKYFLDILMIFMEEFKLGY